MVVDSVLQVYNNLEKWADPRAVKLLPMMGSPLPIVTIFILYISFVLKTGPLLMKNRSAYQLTDILKIYNITQILLNLFLVILGVYWFPTVNVFCTPVKRSMDFAGMFELYGHFLFFLLKVFDLFETVFYVLRKKYNQVTFLHLYHHVLMVVGSWITCRYVPGGQGYFLASINCVVHMIMYVYYFLTTNNPSYKNNVWWKKHLTQVQIVQHCIVCSCFLLALLNPHCDYPKLLLAIYMPLGFLMIYLFADFYVKAYNKEETRFQKKQIKN